MTPTRSTPARGQVQTAVALLLGAVVAVGLVAAVVFSRPGGASGSPATPSARPSPAPTVAPTVAPTDAPSTPPVGGNVKIDLENATNHDVSLQIHGETGNVVKAVSGKPGDGMSIRWHKAIVKNVGARTISVTWAGLPQDEVVDLDVSSGGGKIHLTFVQAGPYANSDAMGEDRILILTFGAPVSADDVSVEILNRTID